VPSSSNKPADGIEPSPQSSQPVENQPNAQNAFAQVELYEDLEAAGLEHAIRLQKPKILLHVGLRYW
jgi:hypothetical protein